ncbi:MAG: hypothetical protein Q9217_005010 [Psora testacea]
MSAPINPHFTDPTLRPFLSSTFSPIDYLNTHFPPPSAAEKQQQTTSSLSTLASQTQTHVSTLNAQTSRLSDTLTELTDDILRTSTRLGYEVELLRGEAVSLAETLSKPGELSESILRFVPESIASPAKPSPTPISPKKSNDDNTQHSAVLPPEAEANALEPPSLPRLRTLLLVRHQLQSVIRVFNLALSFPLPPSLLTTPTSALVSLQSPNADPDAEAKGQAALAELKAEVVDMLRAGDAEGAKARVQELRDVCGVWKGTSEEKARLKWVDRLEQLVRQAEAESGSLGNGNAESKQSISENVEGSAVREIRESAGSAPGFLRRLRDEIYME